MSMWSLKVAGSDSSPLITRYVTGFLRSIDHLRPAGKPAPPRPSRLAASTSAATASGVMVRALRSPAYPPVAR